MVWKVIKKHLLIGWIEYQGVYQKVYIIENSFKDTINLYVNTILYFK